MMPGQQSLFSSNKKTPLAERLRPRNIDELLGQKHLLSQDKPLYLAVKKKKFFSCLFWGPPGCGKTSLARLIAKQTEMEWIALSAVFAGLRDIRAALDKARDNQAFNRQTILFIDEIHRFNKSQQDAFLPVVEDGTIILVGATTENPGFHVNTALLSRLQVFELKRLSDEDIQEKLRQGEALLRKEYPQASTLEDEYLAQIAYLAYGDARKALTWLEQIYLCLQNGIAKEDALQATLQQQAQALDKNGDWFYELLSAFHKSLRGSSVDGALYWFARMIEGGMEPLVIGRRMLCVASEDIGNADPNALNIALNAYMTFERLGAPEGYLALSQAVVYLALAPKSNASYLAMKKAFATVKKNPAYAVPLHLRNAPTSFHKKSGYGEDYRYAHDEPNAYAAGASYLPEEIKDIDFYQPNMRGLEIKLAEKKQRLQKWDEEAKRQKREPS